jgi:hypothetical protein
MGIFLKIIGVALILIGIYGLFVTIPKLIFNIALDEFNPLIMLGLIESGTPSSFFDVILSAIALVIGIIFVSKTY